MTSYALLIISKPVLKSIAARFRLLGMEAPECWFCMRPLWMKESDR